MLALHLTALCQTDPVLSITNNQGTAEISWTGTFNISSLQTTTNLSYPPTTWTELSAYSGPGYYTLPEANQQQFFRFTPILPIFQFAIFYNLNLEIAAASTLTIQGPVFSNAGLWSGSTSITFASTVSAAGPVTNSANDPFLCRIQRQREVNIHNSRPACLKCTTSFSFWPECIYQPCRCRSISKPSADKLHAGNL